MANMVTQPPTLDVGRLPAEMRELVALATQVQMGNPRPYIETFFKLVDDRGRLVPMLFSSEPNQEAYYVALQPYLRDGEDVLCFKDRKARWTAFRAALRSAKFFVKPGTHVLWIANAEDTFNVAHQFVDTFYKNMPAYARPEIKGNEWGIERKVLRFPLPDGGEIINTFTLRTANNPNVGSGETPTDLEFDEYGKFPKTFSMEAQASIRAALPKNASFGRGGTVGPDGPTGAMYEEIQSIKRQERQTIYLFRKWSDNPANALPERHKDRRPADLLDAQIQLGINGGLDCAKEPVLLAQFPQDGIPWQHRIAQRRAWLRDALLAAGGPGNEDAARILFAREHCEDDETPWLLAGRMQFDQSLLEMQIAIANDPANQSLPIPGLDPTINGLKLDIRRRYDPTRIYIGAMDLGGGGGGRSDDTSLQLFDATAKLFIGELHGNKTEPYSAVAAAVLVMNAFGQGPLIVESNRFPGIGNYLHDAPTASKPALNYRNAWKAPQRDGESLQAYWERPYGMHVGSHHHGPQEPSEQELLGQFKSQFNAGAWKVVNPHLLKTMREWNPDTQKHTPDRIAAARLAYLALEMARLLQPVTGAIQRPSAATFTAQRPLVTAGPRHGAGGLWGRN